MTSIHIPATEIRPSDASSVTLDKSEGAGNAGCRCTRAPRVQQMRKERTRAVHRYNRTHSGIPCAMVYGLWRALPGVPGLIAPVACRLSPANLTPASGRQDHTLLPSVPGIARLATPAASIATCPTFVTIGQTPLLVGQDGGRCTTILCF
jgi:hypothetical protein